MKVHLRGGRNKDKMIQPPHSMVPHSSLHSSQVCSRLIAQLQRLVGPLMKCQVPKH